MKISYEESGGRQRDKQTGGVSIVALLIWRSQKPTGEKRYTKRKLTNIVKIQNPAAMSGFWFKEAFCSYYVPRFLGEDELSEDSLCAAQTVKSVHVPPHGQVTGDSGQR